MKSKSSLGILIEPFTFTPDDMARVRRTFKRRGRRIADAEYRLLVHLSAEGRHPIARQA
jgi:hypothetical protein